MIGRALDFLLILSRYSLDQGDTRNAASEREKALRHCNINLPDGSCRPVPIRPGVSIRELLLGLCQKLCINLAAVDLFLVGGEKVRKRRKTVLNAASG